MSLVFISLVRFISALGDAAWTENAVARLVCITLDPLTGDGGGLTITVRRAQQSLKRWGYEVNRVCGTCDGSGVVDSGGIHPWGEAAMTECPECRFFESNAKALESPDEKS